MKEYYYIVTVTCETIEESEQVMAERISPNEDYGFEYSIDWKYSHKDTLLMHDCFSDEPNCSTCDEELLWDSMEMIYYCPNTWEHG